MENLNFIFLHRRSLLIFHKSSCLMFLSDEQYISCGLVSFGYCNEILTTQRFYSYIEIVKFHYKINLRGLTPESSKGFSVGDLNGELFSCLFQPLDTIPILSFATHALTQEVSNLGQVFFTLYAAVFYTSIMYRARADNPN